MPFEVIKIKHITAKKTGKNFTKVLMTTIEEATGEVIYVSSFLPGGLSKKDIESFELRKKGMFNFVLLSSNDVFDAEIFI